MRATRSALSAAADRHGALSVDAIGLSGQMHTMVLVDAAGRALRPAITWMDTRAQAQLERLEALVESAGLAPELANPVVLGLTAPPLLWLIEQEPEVVESAEALLLAKDMLRLRLTGRIGAEPTDVSATLLADVAGRDWSARAARAFGVPVRLLPPVSPSDAVAGPLTRQAADELGLEPGIPVAFGAADQQAAAVAMGTLSPGQAQLMVGTGAQVLAVRERPDADPRGCLHTFCHVRGYVQQASVNNAGAALDWVRELLGVSWERLYASPLAQPHLPAFVPYLSGERAPVMKGYARGAWLGLEPRHDVDALLGAALTGVVTSIADAVAAVVRSGDVRGPVRASGGGMREPRFAQAVSDATGLALEVVNRGSASAVGAALLGGIAAGVHADPHAAAETLEGAEPLRYEPDPLTARAWQLRRSWRAELDDLGLHEHVAKRPEERPE